MNNEEIPGLRPCRDTGFSSPVAIIRWLWRNDDILKQKKKFMYTEGEDFLSSVQRWFLR